MNTNFIDSFVAVVECGSIAEAARRLNLTATALALRVQTLEAEFGCQLLVRSGRTVRPTESGARLAAGAGSLQKVLRELRSNVLGEALPSSLRFGSISTALSGWLPEHLGEVVRLYPRIDVQLVAGVSRDLYHQVQRDQLDMALIVVPPFELPKSLSWRTVRREPLVVLAHKSHAWADPLALLASQPHIRYDRKNWGGALSDQYLQSRRIQPTERVELDALDALEVLVGLGMGVSLVPDWARAKPLGEHLIALPVPDPLYREIGLLWPAGSAHGRLLDALLR
ncbi:LysR family transcriptional regulator [Acidovorax sp. CCYZU-2555]|uniref:LysR family transcriptional regulator n=1 Tax=Acidovorax sp. CCYZU-2555 TaxID=2835042 RepID=UPI001BCD22EE|nr:LysR family transcriptional regulator [Acidovorax sp. CCYZU-2555]MBS7777209.1 LysR family transcriptional regulator [Acidovorax sp. CCYZU-2555]